MLEVKQDEIAPISFLGSLHPASSAKVAWLRRPGHPSPGQVKLKKKPIAPAPSMTNIGLTLVN
jgi:hypothetical protein